MKFFSNDNWDLCLCLVFFWGRVISLLCSFIPPPQMDIGDMEYQKSFEMNIPVLQCQHVQCLSNYLIIQVSLWIFQPENLFLQGFQFDKLIIDNNLMSSYSHFYSSLILVTFFKLTNDDRMIWFYWTLPIHLLIFQWFGIFLKKIWIFFGIVLKIFWKFFWNIFWNFFWNCFWRFFWNCFWLFFKKILNFWKKILNFFLDSNV